MPASNPTTNGRTNKYGKAPALNRLCIDNDFAEILLNIGSTIQAIKTAMANEVKTIIVDSVRN